MEPFDGSLLNRSVHPLDLSINPWMLDLGEVMFNSTFSTNPITGAARELDAVIG